MVSKDNKIRIIIISLLILMSLLLVIINNNKTDDDCGNNICEEIEDCFSCPNDCSCKDNEICDKNTKKCKKIIDNKKNITNQENNLKVICGNNICDETEDCFSCPNDCSCKDNEICDKNTKKCINSCGNGICEEIENCLNCFKDCPCESGEFCDREKKECIKSICGNDICEYYENKENCCNDCGCNHGFICDRGEGICILEYIEPFLTEEEIKNLINQTLRDNNYELKEIENWFTSIIPNSNKKVITVNAITKQDSKKHIFLIDENKEITKLVIFD